MSTMEWLFLDPMVFDPLERTTSGSESGTAAILVAVSSM
jgi:hypothetical protein